MKVQKGKRRYTMVRTSKKIVSAAVVLALLAGTLFLAVIPATAGLWSAASKTPLGMKPMLETLLSGKAVGAWTEGSQDMKSFPWQFGGYFDGSYKNFTHAAWGSWDTVPRYLVMGEDWGGNTGVGIGMGRITGTETMLKGASYRRHMVLTFTAPVTAEYRFAAASGVPDVSLNKTGASNPLGAYKIGFSIHKTSAAQGSVSPGSVTKIWPESESAQYLTKTTESFLMPAIASVSLQAGESIRFVVDYSELPESYDWDATGVCFQPEATILTPVAADNVTVDCLTGGSVAGTLSAMDLNETGTLTYALKENGKKGTAVVNTDGTYTYTALAGATGSDKFVYTAANGDGDSADGTVTVNLQLPIISEPNPRTPLSIRDHMERILTGVPVNEWKVPDKAMQDFPWQVQFFDASQQGKFYTSGQVRWTSWSTPSKPDDYNIGEGWGVDVGMAHIQGNLMFLKGANDRQMMMLTYTVPRDGTYTIEPQEDNPLIRLLNPAQMKEQGKIGIGFYRVSPLAENLALADYKIDGFGNPAGYESYMTKIFPSTDGYEYLTKDSSSMAFPVLENVTLRKGERLRFMVDYRESQFSTDADWDGAAVALCPLVKPVAPFAAVDSTAICTTGRSVRGALQAVDPEESGKLSFFVKDMPSKGTVVMQEDGSYVYTANPDAAGTDSFTFIVYNAYGVSAEGTVEITLVDNKAPVAQKNSFFTYVNKTLSESILPYDDDEDAVTLTLKEDTVHGALTLNADGSFTYVPNSGYAGNDFFAVTLSDGKVTADETIELRVLVNKAPVAVDGVAKTKKNTPVTFTLEASDDNNAPLTYSPVGTMAHGSAVFSGSTVTYTPHSDFTGLDTLSFKVNDGELDSAPAQFRIAVLGDQKINATKSIKEALIECLDDGDEDKAFDFSDFSFDMEWNFQYKFFGASGDLDDLEDDRFEVAVVGKVESWGGYSVGDGVTYPGLMIQGAGFLSTDAICSMNSGYMQDSRRSTAALSYTAQKDGTYFITASSLTDQIGIWQGRGHEAPVEVWIESDGVMLWPKNGEPVKLNAAQETVDMPDILVSLKAGRMVHICMSGTVMNGDDNIIFADADAYDMGAYVAKLDPNFGKVIVPKVKWVYIDPYAELIAANEKEYRALNAGQDGGSYATGYAGNTLWTAAVFVFAAGSGSVLFYQKKKRGGGRK